MFRRLFTAFGLLHLALHAALAVLITLLGYRNRMSALLNLSWRYLTWGHGGGVIVGDDPLPLPEGLLTMKHVPSQ